jgi:hypothetical protein
MRIRSIKPDYWRSEDIAALTREERLLFIGLWSYVDDNGVGIDDYRLIAADLFALDEDQSETRAFVQTSLGSLSRGSLITRYEIDGKRYLHISTWSKHQRVENPNKARFPLPPSEPKPPTSDDTQGRQSEERDSGETPATRGTGTEEQCSKRTTPSRPAAGAEPEGFAAFYAEYPRKRERKKAVIAYRSALRAGASPERLVQAARSYAMANRGKKLDYVKYPASWLNAGAYDDEPEQVGLALVAGGAHVADPGNGVHWEQ